MAKSVSLDNTGVSGMMRRGKYTFVNILALDIELLPELLKAKRSKSFFLFNNSMR